MLRQRLRLLTAVALFASCTFKFDRVLEGGEIRGHLEIEAADGARSPAEGVQVVLLGSQLTAKTDSRGSFVLRNLASGLYTLRVLNKDTTGKQQTALQLSNVTIEAGGDKRGARDVGHVAIEALGGFEGAVMRGSMPVPGAHVVLRDLDQRVTTDEGKYRFTKIPAGNYQVYVLDDEGKLFAGAPKEGVHVTVKPRVIGTTPLPLQQMILAQGGIVSGHVQANGADAVGATIVFSGGSMPVSFTTDDKGRYSGNVPAGVYTILARLDGNTDGVLTNFIVDGDQTVPELTLIPLTSPDAPAQPCAQVIGDAQGPCSPNATCTADGAVASCACLSGFDGDGYNCVPPTVGATCAENHGGCAVHATCTDGSDEVTCACETGYVGNGVTCDDVDECAAQTGPCDANADCHNSDGTFSCQCRTGYTGDGFTCTTDFCAAGPCDANASCTSGTTSATCVCGSGFIGDGTTCAPNFGDVTSGTTHACALRTDGSIWCWGDNSHGQLGVSGDEALYPRQVGTGFTALTAGGEHTCALKMDGTLWCWGDNSSGAAGAPSGSGPARRSSTSSTDITAPTQYGTATWKAASAGDEHTCGLQSDNSLWCWGNNVSGQVGAGDFSSPQGQQHIDAQHTWSAVSAGGAHTCAVRSDGTLWCWGKDDQGQLGNDSAGSPQSAPLQVGLGTDWKSVSSGFDHTCGLRGAAAPYGLWCWGNNARGAVGTGAAGMSPTPQHVGTDQWASVAAGNAFTCGRHTDDSLWCWGANDHGQLATGNTQDAAAPVAITGGGQWTDVAASGSHVCALNTQGALWCWGESTAGVLGNGQSSGNATQPVAQPVIKADACLTAQCSANASCTSTPGHAICTCNPPYTGDGETCTAQTISSLSIEPPSPTVSVGGTKTLSAKATYSDESASDVTSLAVWSSADPLVATVDSSGVLRGVSAGMVEVSATLDGITARTTATVTGGPSLFAFGLTGTDALVVGTTHQMEATAYFDDQTSRDVAAESTWSSDHPEIAQVSATGLVTAVSPGTAMIGALYQGMTASTSVQVVSPTPSSITITPSNPTVNVGVPAHLTAIGHYGEGSDADITHVVTWTSSNSEIATIADGLLQGVSIGVVTITATSGAVSATTQVTVVSVPLVSIEVQPSVVTMAVGMAQPLAAIGHYSDGGVSDLTHVVTWLSSDVAVATIGSDAMIHALSAGTTTITATQGAISGSVQVTVNTNPLLSITVGPPSATVLVGGHQLMTATGTYTDNSTVDLGEQATWTVDNPTIATIDPDGMLHAHSPGNVLVTASLGSISGDANVTVMGPEIVSLTLSPESPTIPIGDEVSFTVTALWTDQTSTDVTAQATWDSSDAAVASFNFPGVLTAVSPGTTNITATVAGFSAGTTVTVPEVTAYPVSIDVFPADANLTVGQTLQFSGTIHFSDGSTVEQATMDSWVVSDPLFGTINATGEFTALQAGTGVVTAYAGGAMGNGYVTIVASPLSSITLSGGPTVPMGQTEQLTVTGHYDDGSTNDVTSQCVWNSSDSSLASVDPSGTFHAAQPGTVQITCSIGAFSDSISITISSHTLVGMTISPTEVSLEIGQTQQFTVTARYDDDTTAEVTSEAGWMVMPPDIATVEPSGLLTAMAAGNATVTAMFNAFPVTASLTVLAPVTVTSIDVSPADNTLPLGATVQLYATASMSDSSTLNVGAVATWTSDNPLVAFVDNSGFVQTAGVGVATIQASYGGQTGSASFTVTTPALTSLDLTPKNANLSVGDTFQLHVTGYYSDGSSQDLSSLVDWTSSDAAVTVDSTGFIQTFGAAVAQITASYQSLAESATVTVVQPTPSSITISPSPFIIAAGLTQQLTATAHYQDGSTQDVTTHATWSVDNSNFGSFDTPGQLQTLAAGSVTVSATYLGVTGVVSGYIDYPAITSLSVFALVTSFTVGDSGWFTVTANYTDGSSQDVSLGATWTSSNSGVASVGVGGLVSAVGPGSASITASLGAFSDSLNVTVTAPTLLSIAMQEDGQHVEKTRNFQYHLIGTYSNGSTQDVTNLATTTSSDPSIAAIAHFSDPPGWFVRGLAVGTATISFSIGSISGSATVVVDAIPLISLAVDPDNGAVEIGSTLQLVATGHYSNGNFDITSQVVWTVNDEGIATVDGGGLLTGVSDGSVQVTATSDAISETITINVLPPHVVSIAVTPATPNVPAYVPFQFTATATYSDNSTADVTDQVTWVVAPEQPVGTFQPSPAGSFVGTQQGWTTIYTFIGEQMLGYTNVYVEAPVLQSIMIGPPGPISLSPGQSQQLMATGTFAAGPPVDMTTDVIWSVDRTDLATINIFTGMLDISPSATPGMVIVTAQKGAVQGTTTITILP